MTEWSEDHMTAIGSLNSNLGLIGGVWLNWRPDRALRWKVETVGREGNLWKADTSKVVALACVG
jgi:hypothetical protein